MTQLRKPDEKSCPTVVLQSVIDEIKQHGRSSMEREVCGVLIGNLCLTEEDQWRVCVEGRIEGKYADNQLGSVTFTSETWDYIHEQLDTHYPNRRIVGWYHTHPGFGIFLSAMDVYIHVNFFSPRWQVAYVYDPQAETDGWFLWGDEKPEPASVVVCDGFHQSTPQTSASLGSNPADFSREQNSEGNTMNSSMPSNPNKMGIMDYLTVGACTIMMIFMILLLCQLERNLANLEKRLKEVESSSENWQKFNEQFQKLSTDVSNVQTEFTTFKTKGFDCPVKVIPSDPTPKAEVTIQPVEQCALPQPKQEPVSNAPEPTMNPQQEPLFSSEEPRVKSQATVPAQAPDPISVTTQTPPNLPK